MKQFVLACIDKRITANTKMVSEARRLGYEQDARVYALIGRELTELREDIELGMTDAMLSTTI